MLLRLHHILAKTAKMWYCEVKEFNGEEDHVHLLIEGNPKVKMSSFINNLKTVSSRLIRKEFREHLSKFYWKPIFWSRSYCLISCGGAPFSIIKQYIENQKGC